MTIENILLGCMFILSLTSVVLVCKIWCLRREIDRTYYEIHRVKELATLQAASEVRGRDRVALALLDEHKREIDGIRRVQ